MTIVNETNKILTTLKKNNKNFGNKACAVAARVKKENSPCQNVIEKPGKARRELTTIMSGKSAISQGGFLHDMVKVKKIRFKDAEVRRRVVPTVSRDAARRLANFEEFRAVYANRDFSARDGTADAPHERRGNSVGRSASVGRNFPSVETVNIELPVHYGGDRAVQLIEKPSNKIPPKKSSNSIHKTSRENLTASDKRRKVVAGKPKKTVTILDKFHDFRETATGRERNSTSAATSTTAEMTKRRIEEMRENVKKRKERAAFAVGKLATAKKRTKSTDKIIMNALTNIDDKLQKMQEKYFNLVKVPYKNVNDCFTQSGDCEVLYGNDKYLEKAEPKTEDDGESRRNVSECKRMHEKLRHVNDMFPVFPQIEDTLKEIEAHLDNIVTLESTHERDVGRPEKIAMENKLDALWNGGALSGIVKDFDQRYNIQCRAAEELLKKREEEKNKKLTTIRKQIDEIEEFCDKLSEIANEEEDERTDATSVSTVVDETTRPTNEGSVAMIDYLEGGPDLRESIRRSSYLSREFEAVRGPTVMPTVKIFSESRRPSIGRMAGKKDYSVESVTRMIDSLKFTLENSFYEPVTQQ